MRKLIKKPGKKSKELFLLLENYYPEFLQKLKKVNGEIIKVHNGYKVSARKFIFWINAQIVVRNEEYEISWETNAPDVKINEVIRKIETILRDT